ncbi:MAG: hypothetical protein IJK76_01255 [Bacteroidales bacterium]|nr:hypothetical protein [Bacteroidales bacterium]
MRAFRYITAALALAALLSCSTQSKLRSLRKGAAAASLALAREDKLPEISAGDLQAHRDTLKVQAPDGREMMIMRAVRNEDGEMVATDVIEAAIVTARFRNVAERHGKVDLRFMVTVPKDMLDSRWQLRLTPEMNVLGEDIMLDPVMITGKEYRKAQLRGYQQYERFLRSIITDTTRFIRQHELEMFLHRNIPDLYGLKTDTTFVSDEAFASIYGVTEREAVDHYTRMLAASYNRRKIERKDRMFERYVKVPIVTEGLRLDTVFVTAGGDFVYEYVQTVNTAPALRRVDVRLSGSIFEEDRDLYSIPPADPLTFYISSLSTLTLDEERYLTQVIGRRVTANSTYWIDFESGKSEINPGLGENAVEISRIKHHLGELLENKEFDLDSIIVTASCSPEGEYRMNETLSGRRSTSVSQYFDRYIRHYRDSLADAAGLFYSLDPSFARDSRPVRSIPFISRNIPENWDMLSDLVGKDPEMNEADRDDFRLKMEVRDPDTRERGLSAAPYYPRMRTVLYPRLRTVRFDFHLHRKGMVKDTVHTTVLDTVYMRGLQAIKDRDYRTAVTLLRPYDDYNAAVAFCCMDYNESALAILERLERTPAVNYLLAIVHSRKGEDQDAVQHYLDACGQDPSYVHRGNLDPEISGLIDRYNLNMDL